MSIISIPTDVQLGSNVICVVCHRQVPLAQATIGAAYADGRPAFGCEVHRADRTTWVLGWLFFATEQRRIKDESNPSAVSGWSH